MEAKPGSESMESAPTSNTPSRTSYIEPILREDPGRMALFPIQYADVFSMYKRAVDSFWRPEEIHLKDDVADFQSMSQGEQYFIKMILAFFANSDFIVGQNLGLRFYNDVPIPEVKAFYSNQMFMETIHNETYSLMIEELVKDKEEKATLFRAVENFPCIRKKAQWAQKWITDKRASFATRLLGFILVEGCHFSSSFCAIYWIKKRGLMPGLTLSNEFISRDEALHTEFGILLYNKLEKKLTTKKVHEIVREAVELEKEFIIDALPCRLIGMNADLMSQYIEFVGDRICLQLQYPVIYGSKNPFNFMELISTETKSNFFERTVSEYALTNTKEADNAFSFDTDF